jgi:hypothetical protein
LTEVNGLRMNSDRSDGLVRGLYSFLYMSAALAAWGDIIFL